MKPPRNPLLQTGSVISLIVGAIIAPAACSLVIGILLLALMETTKDVVLGILATVFSVTAVTGGAFAVLFVRRKVQLARLRAEFVADVAHELRTPLSAIRLLVDSLRADRLADAGEQRRALELIAAETAGLSELVERALDWGDTTLLRQPELRPPQSVALILEDAIRPFIGPAQLEGGRIALDVPPDLPPVAASRDRIITALRNLVHNAVKFAPEGTITIAARPTAEGVEISVADRGPGIPLADQPRIFERFFRGGGRTEQGGTGLGLAISREIVEDHGGRLWLDSRPGEGARFHLLLPFDGGGGD